MKSRPLVMNITRMHGEMHVSMLANRLELEKVFMPSSGYNSIDAPTF